MIFVEQACILGEISHFFGFVSQQVIGFKSEKLKIGQKRKWNRKIVESTPPLNEVAVSISDVFVLISLKRTFSHLSFGSYREPELLSPSIAHHNLC